MKAVCILFLLFAAYAVRLEAVDESRAELLLWPSQTNLLIGEPLFLSAQLTNPSLLTVELPGQARLGDNGVFANASVQISTNGTLFHDWSARTKAGFSLPSRVAPGGALIDTITILRDDLGHLAFPHEGTYWLRLSCRLQATNSTRLIFSAAREIHVRLPSGEDIDVWTALATNRSFQNMSPPNKPSDPLDVAQLGKLLNDHPQSAYAPYISFWLGKHYLNSRELETARRYLQQPLGMPPGLPERVAQQLEYLSQQETIIRRQTRTIAIPHVLADLARAQLEAEYYDVLGFFRQPASSNYSAKVIELQRELYAGKVSADEYDRKCADLLKQVVKDTQQRLSPEEWSRHQAQYAEEMEQGRLRVEALRKAREEENRLREAQSRQALATNASMPRAVEIPLRQPSVSAEERLRHLEGLGRVPDDADATDWLLAQKTSWWGKPVDPDRFWTGRTVWLDAAAISEAERFGRKYPPIPSGQEKLIAEICRNIAEWYRSESGQQLTLLKAAEVPSPATNSVALGSVSGVRITPAATLLEERFWSRSISAYPRPPEELAKWLGQMVYKVLGGRSASRKLIEPFTNSLTPREKTGMSFYGALGYPTEALSDEALVWTYVLQMREMYQQRIESQKLRGTSLFSEEHSQDTERWLTNLVVDRALITQPLNAEQRKAANAWKVTYLQRLRKEKVDESYINAYLKAWSLSTEEVFSSANQP
jgi:hypothetical protein